MLVVRKVTNSVAPELEGSALRLKYQSTGLYPEPTESNPHLPANIS
jgi:hypothetical protein